MRKFTYKVAGTFTLGVIVGIACAVVSLHFIALKYNDSAIAAIKQDRALFAIENFRVRNAIDVFSNYENEWDGFYAESYVILSKIGCSAERIYCDMKGGWSPRFPNDRHEVMSALMRAHPDIDFLKLDCDAIHYPYLKD